MDVRVKNYVASQEGWLYVTPGRHTIKYWIVERLKQPSVAKHPCIRGVKDWKTAVKEPVSSCSSTTEHKCL